MAGIVSGGIVLLIGVVVIVFVVKKRNRILPKEENADQIAVNLYLPMPLATSTTNSSIASTTTPKNLPQYHFSAGLIPFEELQIQQEIGRE